MTKWWVALPFALMFFVGLVGVFAGLNGKWVGLVFGVPFIATATWFFGTRYVGTNG